MEQAYPRTSGSTALRGGGHGRARAARLARGAAAAHEPRRDEATSHEHDVHRGRGLRTERRRERNSQNTENTNSARCAGNYYAYKVSRSFLTSQIQAQIYTDYDSQHLRALCL